MRTWRLRCSKAPATPASPIHGKPRLTADQSCCLVPTAAERFRDGPSSVHTAAALSTRLADLPYRACGDQVSLTPQTAEMGRERQKSTVAEFCIFIGKSS